MGIKGVRLRAIAILSTVAALVLGTATVASAAPPYQSEADITSLAFTSQTVQSGSSAQLEGTWSLPDTPATPAGFAIALPAELAGRTGSFPLTDAAGATMGRCTVTTTQLYCDLDSAYVAAHPLDLHGTFDFWVTVKTTVDHDTTKTYDVGGTPVTTTVTPPANNQCTENCTFQGRGSYKSGTYDEEHNAIDWTVAIGAGKGGMAGGQTVTVQDNPGPAQELVTKIGNTTYPYVLYTNTVGKKADGTYWPTGWRVLDPSKVTVDGAGKVSFVSEAGYFYNVHFATAPTDADQGGTHTYTNGATISISGQGDGHVSGTVVHQGGGATGGGTQVGRFSITKHVEWTGTPVDGLTFSGTYAVTAPGGVVTDGTFEVADGATWTSPAFPAGSTVHLTENTPSGPAGVTWAAPDFSQNDFALSAATTTVVTLTNHATVTPTPTPSGSVTPRFPPTVSAEHPEYPSSTATPRSGQELALTGGTVAGWVAPFALLFVVIGAALIGVRARRS